MSYNPREAVAGAAVDEGPFQREGEMQVMANGRVRRTEEEWREILARWKTSGVGVREFCRKEGVQAVSFLRWQQRVGATEGRRAFVPVVAVSPSGATAATWSVELVLPTGARLRMQG